MWYIAIANLARRWRSGLPRRQDDHEVLGPKEGWETPGERQRKSAMRAIWRYLSLEDNIHAADAILEHGPELRSGDEDETDMDIEATWCAQLNKSPLSKSRTSTSLRRFDQNLFSRAQSLVSHTVPAAQLGTDETEFGVKSAESGTEESGEGKESREYEVGSEVDDGSDCTNDNESNAADLPSIAEDDEDEYKCEEHGVYM